MASKCLGEVTDVRNIVETLLKIAGTDTNADLPTLQSMNDSNEPASPLRQCLTELLDLKALLKPDKNSKLNSTNLLWPLRRTEVKKRLDAIARIKATLQLAVSADNAQNIVDILNNARTLPRIEEQLGILKTQIETDIRQRTQDNERESFLRWLSADEQALKYRSHCEKRVKGTGQWLLQHESYLKWKKEPGEMLWLSGIGQSSGISNFDSQAGADVDSANIIEDLEAHCNGLEDATLVYFLIDGSEQKSFNIERLRKTFAGQLLSRRRHLLPYMVPYESKEFQPETSLQDKLCRYLRGEYANFGHMYLVIDGVDECKESVGVDALMNLLKSMRNDANQRLHTLISSRDLEQIRQSVATVQARRLVMQDKPLQLDIRRIVQSHLSDNTQFARWPTSIKTKVETSLTTQAQDSKCSTLAAVRKVLDNLSESLEAHYKRVLENVDEVNKPLARNLLKWVAFSLRPLSVDELACSMPINTEGRDFPYIDEELELLDMETFLDSFSTFVTTFCGISDPAGGHRVYVKLAHFSVKEFLISEAVMDGACSAFALEKELAHSCLAKSCLLYLQEITEFLSDEARPAHPFLEYAASFWPVHLRMGKQTWTSPRLKWMLEAMFDDRDVNYKNWQSTSCVDKPWLDRGLEEQQRVYEPLYCAAYLGLGSIVDGLLYQGAKPNTACGLYGCPLQAAAVQGHVSIVQALLEADADVNHKGGRYGSAIAAAAAKGHEKVVAVLIGAGAKAQPFRKSFGTRGRDPLVLAAINGHCSICEVLLSHGAEDYFSMKGRPASALQAAAQNGHLDIVRILLKRKGQDFGSITASQASAAQSGHIKIVRELLPYGSNARQLKMAARAGDTDMVLQSLRNGASITHQQDRMDEYDLYFPTAIQGAARGGHVSTVRTLLSEGADPSNALTHAVEGGSLEIVRMLLDAGTDVNEKSSSRPLKAAAERGRRDLVDLLLQNGADPSDALTSAVRGGRLEIAQMLLDAGADVNENSSRPLQLAIDRGRRDLLSNVDIFRLLVELGADPALRRPEDAVSMLRAAAIGGSTPIVQFLLETGHTPVPYDRCTETSLLTEAIRCHRWQIVQLLLEAGADVNPSIGADAKCSDHYSPNEWNWPPPKLEETPLSCAIKERNEEIARLLIDRGALVAPQTPPTTGAPLVYAAKERMVELVRDLLSRGADANQQGTFVSRGQPTLPIVLAAQVGNEEMVRLLINAGADPNGQDSEGFSALHKSAECCNPDVLKVLLEEYNGDIGLRLLNGSRPIHSAASFGRVEQIKTLLDAGADIDSQNDDGRTPLHWAVEAGCWDLVELLLDRGAATDIREYSTALTALDLAQLARQEPTWDVAAPDLAQLAIQEPAWATWIEGSVKRIDGLMERLKPRAKIR
ncbi:hypothetical protein H2202_005778 [Exophiala xenobiotica]|nr:hypothetical protein H2202_005778 [Exophiala xenobiotica]